MHLAMVGCFTYLVKIEADKGHMSRLQPPARLARTKSHCSAADGIR